MAEETTTEAKETQEPKKEETPQSETDWKALARKWEKRAKANAKELEDIKAANTDDANARTADELAKAKEKIKELETAQAREKSARAIAREVGVDAEVLIRMRGDSEDEIKENAELLSKSSKAKWPNVPDNGSSKPASKVTKDEILSIKNPVEQLRTAARNLDAFK